ncbi:hypothetical protein B0H14DRAFT_3512967 [Mycena olivaceomarginata]|nr:hypothetical protein B0H14DRAFT_3512967 [Mycena olivaceomarginata]
MASHIPTDEETDDEGSEWAIRVGNSPPPLWGVDYGDGTKQRRLKVIADIRLHAPADMPVLLQAIQEIAAEFRFTVEEVQAYYDRCGEIGSTRTRFQNMRELLTMEFPEDE